jgi:hypothetical protein
MLMEMGSAPVAFLMGISPPEWLELSAGWSALPNGGHSDVLIGWQSRVLHDAQGAATAEALAVQEQQHAWGYGTKRDEMLQKHADGDVQGQFMAEKLSFCCIVRL